MSFRTRLALFLVVTLVAVQALTAAFAYLYLRHNLVERGKRELTAEMGVFTRQLDFLSERVTDAVKVSSLDYALRSAIAQHNRDTELSALRNHGQRIGASRMMLVALDGSLEVDTAAPSKVGGEFRYPDLLGDASASNQASALTAIDNRVYWIVTVPVRAPVPIAFLTAFIPVDSALLERLRALSAERRAILLATPGTEGALWQAAAETSHNPGAGELAIAPNPLRTVTTETLQGDQDALVIASPLSTAKGSAPVVAMISYPLDEALAAYRSVLMPLLGLLALALSLAVVGTMIVVRGLARPLEQLAAAARRIASGDYSTVPSLPQRDEIGHLGQALNHMARAIGDREAALKHALESAERAREDAVCANRAKSHFLANMSHELRTPLNAILGFSEMVEQQMVGPISTRYIGYAKDIRTSAGNLLCLLERMLDVADTESGQLELARVRLRPIDLLGTAAAELNHFAHEKGVRLKTGASAPALLEMEGDPARLKQAFTNIVHNAIKFTAAGGEVRVSCSAQNGLLSIRVTDSGIGIAPDLLVTIARPFQRLRSALDGQHQGAGLGLSFAKAVIELHGGRFELASEVGTGTTASVELPVQVNAVSQAA